MYPNATLRTAATLHHTFVLGHVAAEPLFLVGIPVPSFLEGVQVELHDLREDLALALLFDALDEFVEDPGTGDELCINVSVCSWNGSINVPLD
jgi:hypothetical protein